MEFIVCFPWRLITLNILKNVIGHCETFFLKDSFLFFFLSFLFFFFFFFFFWFLLLPPQHMAVPSLGVQLELQLLAYTRATATQDLSHVYDLYNSSGQCQVFNPLSEARDWTLNLMSPTQIHFQCAMTGTPERFFSSAFAQV